MQFLGQTSIRREVSLYEERHIPTILEGRVNCTSPVTLVQPSCNSIPKLGLFPAERLPWSGGIRTRLDEIDHGAKQHPGCLRHLETSFRRTLPWQRDLWGS